MTAVDICMKLKFGELDSGIYTSTDDQNRTVIVKAQKDVGIEISTLQSNGWWEIVEYDLDGTQDSVSYSKQEENDA